MSSIAIGWWSYSNKGSKEILSNNKRYFKDKVSNLLEEIIRTIDNLLQSKKEIKSKKEIVDVSSNLKKDVRNIFQKITDYFNEQYTLDVVKSSHHTIWFDGKIAQINNISMIIKKLAKEISFETDFSCSIEDIREILRIVDSFSSDLFEYLSNFGFSKKQILHNLRNFLQSEITKLTIKEEYDKLILNLDQKFSKLNNPLLFDFYELLKKDIHSTLKRLTDDFTVFSKEFEHEIQKINKFINNLDFIHIDKSCDLRSFVLFLEKVDYIYPQGEFDNYIRSLKEKLYNQEVDEYFEKLKQEIHKKRTVNDKQIPTTQKSTENIKDKILLFFKKIESNFPEEYGNIKNKYYNQLENYNLTKLRIILDSLKVEYLKLKKRYSEDMVYRQEIINILNEFKQIVKGINEEDFELYPKYNSVVNKINDVLSKKFVTEEDYKIVSNLVNDITQKMIEYIELKNRKKYREKIETKLRQNLEKLGYKLISQNRETQVIYIDTKFSKEYKIMLKITDNSLNVQFVRIIPDGYVPTEYDKRRDISFAKKWCSDYKKLLKLLHDSGILVENQKLVEPEQKMNYLEISKIPLQLQEDVKYHLIDTYEDEGKKLHREKEI
ncbi:MAG: hypothetical protein RMJ36_06230 [Candidatus Calescibacterium sp.]|nr:hypothetical protein [Candidatus Calescibacterium sp.]MDW8133233.1 hypothetical protein [Candidatus Calescibacterium sp.]